MLKKALAAVLVAVVLVTASVATMEAKSDDVIFQPMTGGKPPWQAKP
ncbi:hypothetical protein ACI2JA_03770 [Alkalihalobacillus sp. NPDC078783]